MYGVSEGHWRLRVFAGREDAEPNADMWATADEP